MILADAASNGEKVTKGGFYNLPLGWTSKGEKQLMKDMNIDRRQTITDLLAELKEAGAIDRRQQLRKNAMTFVDIDWLKANSWPAPEATNNEASESEGSGSVTRAGSDPEVHNEKRATCATESVASKMPRKALPDTTESVATSTPVFDPVVDTPAPVGEITRSRVRTDNNRSALDAPQVWQEPEAKAAPKAKPEPAPRPEPPRIHRFERSQHFGKSDVCSRCGMSAQEYHCSGRSDNPANTCPPSPCERNVMCVKCGAERDGLGRCMPCIEKGIEARRKAKEEAAATSITATQIADLLSADKVEA
jgi:hypothetical protein